MKTYKARDLLNLTQDELWAMPDEYHKVLFEDGNEIITTDRLTKHSVTLWNPLKEFEGTTIKSSYHFGSNRVTASSILEILNSITWGIHSDTNETVDMDRLAKVIMETNNIYYNETTIRLGAYVTTLSMFDMDEVYQHPRIRAANKNIEATTHGIEEVSYKEIKATMRDPNELRGNIITDGLKSGTQKDDGLLQTFGPRGFPTDSNSSIFPEACLTGYAEGIWGLTENMMESRSGTKALLYNKELLKDTEYFNRKSQLIAQYVKNLHHGDCGGLLLDFPITSQTLKAMNGTYYLNESTNKLDWLKGDEKHLIGKKVKARLIIGCVHPDPQGVCSVCYGRLAFNVPYGTNIGHMSATTAGNKITSAVLSTKHTDASSAVEQFVIGGIEAKYLRVGKEEETLYLKKEVVSNGYRLVVNREEATNLADILMIDNLDNYPVESSSELERIGLIIGEGDDISGDVLTVSLYNRKASFSLDLLKHIKRKRWSLDNKDNIVIDLSGFNTDKPFLTLPNKHVNMYEVMKRIQSFLHSGSDPGGRKLSSGTVKYVSRTYLKNFKDPVEGLATTVALLNDKFKLNRTHCEILMYCMMIVSAQNKDYRLPKPGVSGQFERYNRLMSSRSLSCAMAYQEQHLPLMNPASFNYRNRNDHPYDLAVLGERPTAMMLNLKR